MADEHRLARLRRNCPPRSLRRLMQRGQRILHAGAVDILLLEAGDDLRPAGAVCEQSVYKDDILRLWRCLGAGDSIEEGKGGASSDSPDQCPAVHHSLLLNYGDLAPYGKIAPRVSSGIGLIQICVCRNCFGAAPRHVACGELYGGRSGNRWPDLVVDVSELRHSAMFRPRTRYAANCVTHTELEDHRGW